MPPRIPMTARQRQALLALPDTEEAVIRLHSLSAADHAGIATARTPGTRLGYALQLCCLRHPGRHPRRGEVIPSVMLQHLAEQIGVAPEHVAGFARRPATRYDQMLAIKRRHGFSDLSRPLRAELETWLAEKAIRATDGLELLERLIAHMRERRIVIPGVSVVERMTAEAMHAADRVVTATVVARLTAELRDTLDALLSEKEHARQSRLSWLREPAARVSAIALLEQLDRLALVRTTGATTFALPAAHEPRLAQMAREGLRFTAQVFQQMAAPRRYATLVATMRELEATLTDAILSLFQALVARANLRARKRLEATIAVSADQGRAGLIRIADVLDALTGAVERKRDIASAVTAVAALDVIKADAALIRRTTRSGKPTVIDELAPEHVTFRKIGSRLLSAFTWEGNGTTVALRQALTHLSNGQDRRRSKADLPVGHLDRRWLRRVVGKGSRDLVFWELGTWFALADALAGAEIWVPGSRLHRPLAELLSRSARVTPTSTASVPAVVMPPHPLGRSADAWLAQAAAELDTALLEAERTLVGVTGSRGDWLSLRDDAMASKPVMDTAAKRITAKLYGLMPTMRVTDVLAQVDRWTDFVAQFGHVSTGLPPTCERTFLAALIAEATNLGLSRMAEVCGVASRRALIRMQTWHMRAETFRAALACLTDAIDAEPMAAWFGSDTRASADGQHFHLGGPGEARGQVNGHYGRDPIVKIYTTITGRQAPLHQTVIAGTAGEAVHALDGLYGHDSAAAIAALHVDGGGVSDIVFALTHLLGLDFEPRLPRLSDRRLYAFEPRSRYGRLAPLFGQRLEPALVQARWNEMGEVVTAVCNRTVVPSVILKKLSALRPQNGLAAAFREVGRVRRTLFTLRWVSEPPLRRFINGELNKGESRNSLSRAVAFHRLGRFRDRDHENQQLRAAALNLVTACIVLFNCRYLDRSLVALRARGIIIDDALLPHLSPLGWDHINLTGDYVWSDALPRSCPWVWCSSAIAEATARALLMKGCSGRASERWSSAGCR